MTMKLIPSAVVVAAMLAQVAHALPTRQFEHFFPSWNEMIQKILREHCADEYAVYLSETYPEGENVGKSALVTPVIDCVLDQFPNFRQTELAASAVILGAMPSLLQGLGSLTAETALLSLRRPVLAFLLAAGSPTVVSMKGSEFSETLAGFVEGGQGQARRVPGLRWNKIPRSLRPIISLVQYLLTAAALANVISLVYQLGVHSIVVFAPETIFMIPLWAFLAAVIHVGGVITLHVRVKTISPKTNSDHCRQSGFPSWTPSELIPSALQPTKRFIWRDDNILFVVLSWLLNVGTMAHVVFGTLIYSSLLFFSVIDAVTIVARYCASAIICRAVVRMELSGMGQYGNYEVADGEDDLATESIPLRQESKDGTRLAAA